jgi:chaperonin GroEL
MDDALAATRAAVAEGVVAGGGTALVKAVAALANKKINGDHEYQAGYSTLLKALNEPLKQIVINAGKREAAVVLDEIIKAKTVNFGYNAKTDKFEDDMIKSGIIDPLKVTRTALENAVSVSAMLLTTEAVVTDLPEEKGAQMPPMGGMPGMGMM